MTTPFRPRQAPRSRTGGAEGASRGRHPTARRGGGSPPGRRSTVFVVLLVCTAVLVLLGLVMVLSASMVTDLREQGTAWYSFGRQAVWVVVGIAALLAALHIDYARWRRWATPMLVVSLVLLALVLVSGVGLTRGGATRWIGFGPFVLQPSEITKLAVVLWMADLLDRRSDRMHVSRATMRPVLVLLALVSALLLLQPNQGTLAIIAVIAFTVLFAGGAPLFRLGAWVGMGAGAAVALSTVVAYRRERLLAFLDPWADAQGSGWQTVQSTVGIASGGLFGVGLGESRAKWGFLPEAHTDFIFSIVAEELGLLGAAIVLGLFATMAVAGVAVARGCADRFGMLVATGISTWFAFQAVVNVGAATGTLPVTGVPLPFVSFGGSALVVNLAAMGILLNIARHAGRPASPPASARRRASGRPERPGRRPVSSRHPAAPVG